MLPLGLERRLQGKAQVLTLQELVFLGGGGRLSGKVSGRFRRAGWVSDWLLQERKGWPLA